MANLLLIRTLARGGLLPSSRAPWPPPVRRLLLAGPGAVVLIRQAAYPPGSLEIAGLPSGGALTVPIERLPFHHSPGRWHFRCPACGQLRGVLVEVGEQGSPAARALGWACRLCAGLPKSRAWALDPEARLDNALDQAAEERRRLGEKARDWRRRRQRAREARQKAAEADAGLAARLAKQQGS